ncbi:hypothetical protein MNBD_GAMMA07-1994 [hydrothermal vent metagenome]|uniref:Abi-like protein n=1 Tax=hydrothermal vent metagenome TaxID=652676 RepID=A0A3B0X0Z3_9ZZZZ
MQSYFSDQLTIALSPERLNAYKDRITSNGQLNLFSHCAWNIALSESLYPSLQTLEIALRNTIHVSASTYFKRDDWFNDASIIHNHYNINAITKAKNTLQRKQKSLDSGRIIAELNFGFWTSLFDSRFEQVLWHKIIKTTFPHMPKTYRTRQNLSQRFNKIRNLRNRVFHHEPIWYWQDLQQQHKDILSALRWISPEMSDLVMTVDRFDVVYNNSFEKIKTQLRTFC